MDVLIKLLTVFALGSVELLAAVPAGFAFGLHPIVTGVVAAAGALTGLTLVVFLGEQVRAWWSRRAGAGRVKGRHRLVMRIWERYGVIGLGLLGPVLLGTPVGAALGVSLGASPERLLRWMATGVILSAAALTGLTAFGLAGVERLAG